MKFLVAFVAVVVVAHAANLTNSKFGLFKASYNKSYGSIEEEQLRAAIFESNLKQIDEHNKRFAEGKETYKMGVNQFADMTHKEFVDFLKMSGPNPIKTEITNVFTDSKVKADLVDWREQNAVTDVKNQGSCGACWAFSATGSLEAANFLKTGNLLTLSEQQLIDCSRGTYGNAGCGGGFMVNAFDYIKEEGITTEDQYPYIAQNGFCKGSINITDIEVKGYTNVKSSEDSLAAAVETVGPVSVAVDASYFHFYESGIYTDDRCHNTYMYLNHGVLVVGFAPDYWIIKNSWGESWGEQGYIKLARNHDNLCGITVTASYPNL